MAEFFNDKEKEVIEKIKAGLKNAECDSHTPLIEPLEAILSIFISINKRTLEISQGSTKKTYSLTIDPKLEYPEIRLGIEEEIIQTIAAKIKKLIPIFKDPQLKDEFTILSPTGYRQSKKDEINTRRFRGNTSRLREVTFNLSTQSSTNKLLQDFLNQINAVLSLDK